MGKNKVRFQSALSRMTPITRMCHGVCIRVSQAMCFGVKYLKLVEICLTDWGIIWSQNISINGNACKEISKA